MHSYKKVLLTITITSITFTVILTFLFVFTTPCIEVNFFRIQHLWWESAVVFWKSRIKTYLFIDSYLLLVSWQITDRVMKKQNFIQKREVKLSYRILLSLALPKEANEMGETSPPAPHPGEHLWVGLVACCSFISKETKRGVWPHCLSQALHSPLASVSARVCVCVCMRKSVCECVCLMLLKWSGPLCVLSQSQRVCQSSCGWKPLSSLASCCNCWTGGLSYSLPDAPPPHDPASPFLLGSVSEAADRLTLWVLFCDTNARDQLLPRRPLVSVETNATGPKFLFSQTNYKNSGGSVVSHLRVTV